MVLGEVVFIEAVPFASRLHVLAPLVLGAHLSGVRVEVRTFTRAAGEDLDAFAAELPLDVRVDFSQAASLKSPRAKAGTRALLKLLELGPLGPGETRLVVLTAVDDYPPSLIFLAFRLRLMRATRVLFIRYRVDDYPQVSPRPSLRQLAKRVYFGGAARIARSEVALFDERVPPRKGRHLLPDPWTGAFGEQSRSQARRELGWPGAAPTVLLVGYQDDRKGFSRAVRVLVRAADAERRLHVHIVGRVAPEFSADLALLREKFGARLTHVEEYVSDQRMATTMSAADLILLPYSEAFTSTSGVLVRAAASRTPVLSTAHGLVGWRVLAYRLGRTFPVSQEELAPGLLVEMLRAEHDPARGEQYAASATAGKLSEAFRRVVQGI